MHSLINVQLDASNIKFRGYWFYLLYRFKGVASHRMLHPGSCMSLGTALGIMFRNRGNFTFLTYLTIVC